MRRHATAVVLLLVQVVQLAKMRLTKEPMQTRVLAACWMVRSNALAVWRSFAAALFLCNSCLCSLPCHTAMTCGTAQHQQGTAASSCCLHAEQDAATTYSLDNKVSCKCLHKADHQELTSLLCPPAAYCPSNLASCVVLCCACCYVLPVAVP